MNQQLSVHFGMCTSREPEGSSNAECTLIYDPDDNVTDEVHDARLKQLSELAHRLVREVIERDRPVTATAALDDSSDVLRPPLVNHANQRQLKYARQLAKQVPQLGVRQLDALAKHVFAKTLVELSRLKIGAIIDLLKDFKAERIPVPLSLRRATS